MKKGKIRKKVIAIALAVTMMLPSALSAVPVVNAAEKSTSENRTTEYLSDHLQEQKAEKAEALSENYWEKDAPKDAKEAAAMYVEDASDGKVTADNSGAGKEDENLEDLEVSTNQDAFDEHGLRETSHSVRVTYTIANEKYLKVDTIDDLFEKNTEAFLTSIVSTSPVYESKENDCYIAFLNYGKLNGLGSKIIDADFVTNTQMNPKDVKEDIVFDKKTGIVYIPKSYYFSVDGTELGYDPMSVS